MKPSDMSHALPVIEQTDEADRDWAELTEVNVDCIRSCGVA